MCESGFSKSVVLGLAGDGSPVPRPHTPPVLIIPQYQCTLHTNKSHNPASRKRHYKYNTYNRQHQPSRTAQAPRSTPRHYQRKTVGPRCTSTRDTVQRQNFHGRLSGLVACRKKDRGLHVCVYLPTYRCESSVSRRCTWWVKRDTSGGKLGLGVRLYL